MGLGVWNTEPGLHLDLFYTQININSGYGPTEGYSEVPGRSCVLCTGWGPQGKPW